MALSGQVIWPKFARLVSQIGNVVALAIVAAELADLGTPEGAVVNNRPPQICYGSEVSVCWRAIETSEASIRPLPLMSSRKLEEVIG